MIWERFTRSANGLAVNAYKVSGFVVLALILMGLTGYVVVNVFYLFNRQWIAPVILSPQHERVIQLSAQLAQQRLQREKLVVERRQLEMELAHVERTIVVNSSFKEGFEVAITQDESARRKELKRLRRLRRKYRKSKTSIDRPRSAYAALARKDSDAHLGAGIIDRETYLQRNYLAAQITSANLSLEETGAELRSRADELKRKVTAMRALRSGMQRRSAPEAGKLAAHYDVLMMHQELARVEAELERLLAAKVPMREQMAALDEAIDTYDQILESLQGSPYLRAMNEQVTIAFVPYENLANVRARAPVYGCFGGLVFCRRVGQVVRVLDGEVAARHPLRNHDLRGVMVEIALEDDEWARERALHVNRAPFLL